MADRDGLRREVYVVEVRGAEAVISEWESRRPVYRIPKRAYEIIRQLVLEEAKAAVERSRVK